MKIVVGVDWSDEEFAALSQTVQLYRPTEVTLVHAVDIGLYFDQEAGVEHETESADQLLNQSAEKLPRWVTRVHKINHTASPAQLILDSADKAEADLVVIGSRGRGRLAEAFLGSVSSRVLLYNSRSTLVVKGEARRVQRVLVAIEGADDGDRIVQWLTRHPFNNRVEVCVFHAVVPYGVKKDLQHSHEVLAVQEEARRRAETAVNAIAEKIAAPSYKVTTKVLVGKPSQMIQEQAQDKDLVVMSSHGRQGLSRFLMGSVSHTVVHDVSCPVLVVR